MNPTRFVALHCGEETQTLLARHPNAFLLLCQIAIRARWKDCPITKLKTGEAFIGDWKECGLRSEMAYRCAKKVLTECQLVAFTGTNKGTRASLRNESIFSLSVAARNGPDNRPANEPVTTPGTDEHRASNDPTTTIHTENNEHPHSQTSAAKVPAPQSERERELIRLVKSLRPEWQGSDFLDSQQKPLFDANRRQLEAFTEDDWAVQREFFKAKPSSMVKEIPEKLWVYLQSPERTNGIARGWKEKARTSDPKPTSTSFPPRKVIPRNELAETFSGFKTDIGRKPAETLHLTQEAATP